MGKARKLIEAIGREDERLSVMLPAAWEPVRAQGYHPRKAVTHKFVGRLKHIQEALPSGALDLRLGGKRRGMFILMSRAVWSRARLGSWNAPKGVLESGLSIYNLGYVITPGCIHPTHIIRANISIHAVARAYQRMCQASDAAVVAAMLPLASSKAWSETCGSSESVEFTVNGWRGKAVSVPEDDTDVFGVRTYGDWD
jgi:hypothetical protein